MIIWDLGARITGVLFFSAPRGTLFTIQCFLLYTHNHLTTCPSSPRSQQARHTVIRNPKSNNASIERVRQLKVIYMFSFAFSVFLLHIKTTNPAHPKSPYNA